MNIRIKQQGDLHPDTDLIHSAAKYMLNEFDEDELDTLNLVISLVKHMPNNHIGLTSSGNGKIQVKLKKSLSTLALLKTLAHELVHVRQMHTGELTTSSTKRSWIWKGKRYTKDRYPDFPWEDEAHYFETPLTISFLSHYLTHI